MLGLPAVDLRAELLRIERKRAEMHISIEKRRALKLAEVIACKNSRRGVFRCKNVCGVPALPPNIPDVTAAPIAFLRPSVSLATTVRPTRRLPQDGVV
jgi:hypothetical protein